MKFIKSLILPALLFFAPMAHGQFLKKLKESVTSTTTSLGFTEEEAGNAIKEALQKGIVKGVGEVAQLDGYFGNPLVKIPFPEEAKFVESQLRAVGMGKLADDAILSLNRAAEDAAGEAKDIFIVAIKQLTFKDAIEIVRGEDNAATAYLQNTTSDSLKARFQPIIAQSIEKVDATRYWDNVMTEYNKIPFMKKINPNLEEYVTEKAIEGLFVMVAQEEEKIREDPMERTSDILKKVFGSEDK